MINERKIMKMIRSITRQIDNMDCCPHCYTPHGEPFPDKRTMSLAIQLARVVMIRGTSEFALDEDVYDTLTEFLRDYGGDHYA